MRLIDANELKVDISITRLFSETDGLYVEAYSEEQINEAPTVDAIPIEFIRRFVMFSPPSCYTIHEYGDEFFDEDSWCNDLLEDWRKENEAETKKN